MKIPLQPHPLVRRERGTRDILQRPCNAARIAKLPERGQRLFERLARRILRRLVAEHACGP